MSDSNGYKVMIGGQEISPDATSAKGVVCDLHIDMMSMAEVTLSETAKPLFSNFKLAQEVEVKMGGSDDAVFKGVVTEIRMSLTKGDTSMRIIAMDPLVKLYASRESKAYEKMSDSDIVKSVISAAGATASADATTGKSDYVIQRNESNLTFAKRLAARNNFHLRANGKGEVEFKKAQFAGTPVDVPFEGVISLEYRMSTIDVPPSVKLVGWDPVDKKKVEANADSGKVDTIGGGKNVVSDTAQLLWKNPSHVSDVQVSAQGSADAMASSDLNRAARNFLRGVVRVSGNATLVPGKLLKISGNEAGFNPTGYIIGARHIIDGSVYTSEIHFISNTYPE